MLHVSLQIGKAELVRQAILPAPARERRPSSRAGDRDAQLQAVFPQHRRPYAITASVSFLAVKYAHSGWWETSALTLASGSIIMPSVSPTPMSSGRSSFHIACWSSRLGQAASPKL